MLAGSPMCTGAPCTLGKRDVICTARIASAGLNARMVTTSGPLNGPAGDGLDIGHVHRRDVVALEKFQPHPRLLQRLLERERAAEREGHEVVAPIRADVGHFLDEFTVAENVVARDVGADVEIVGERGQARIAGIRAGDQRAGPRIALAIEQEILGPGARQDADIGLHEAGRDAGGVAGIACRRGSRAAPRADPHGPRPSMPGFAPRPAAGSVARLAALHCYKPT